MVTKLGCLVRSTAELLAIEADLSKRKVGLAPSARVLEIGTDEHAVWFCSALPALPAGGQYRIRSFAAPGKSLGWPPRATSRVWRRRPKKPLTRRKPNPAARVHSVRDAMCGAFHGESR
jgi:hypothetical protein